MLWFRTHRPVLVRLAFALWLLAFGVAASQGCLTQPSHDRAAAHATAPTGALDHSHAQHASGCLQHCEDSSVALNPAQDRPAFDPAIWAVLWLLPALSLSVATASPFAFLALRRPAPPRPPARLSFVRFND